MAAWKVGPALAAGNCVVMKVWPCITPSTTILNPKPFLMLFCTCYFVPAIDEVSENTPFALSCVAFSEEPLMVYSLFVE